MNASLAVLDAALTRISTPAPSLTAEQIIEALQSKAEISIDFGSGATRRSVYVEDEPQPGQDFCSFRASRATDKNGGAQIQRFDRLDEALQWLLAR
jgi:hypothetical protein